MNAPMVSPEQAQWMCAHCGCALVVRSVNVTYLGSGYPVDLLQCPQCGMVLVPEDLALGKMAEVEKILEDK
jgi:predicted RNA-binding Zn-ribbon protein involved in translation (DUF1610 family)